MLESSIQIQNASVQISASCKKSKLPKFNTVGLQVWNTLNLACSNVLNEFQRSAFTEVINLDEYWKTRLVEGKLVLQIVVASTNQYKPLSNKTLQR